MDRIKLELSYKSFCSMLVVGVVALALTIRYGYSWYFIIQAVALLIVSMLGLFCILQRKKWRFMVHIFCVFTIVVQFIEIVLSQATSDFLLMQYCFTTITISFVLLSNLYGFIYAGLSSFAIILLLIQRFNGDYSAYINNNFTTLIMCLFVITYIMFICFNFIEALRKMIAQVNRSKSEEKQLNNELILITKNAEISVQQHSDFLSSMSHELRTPLNSVIGFANLLLEKTKHKEQEENLRYLLSSAESLLALINDVLDFSKLESGKLNLEYISFDMISIIKRVFHAHQSHAQEKEISYILDLDICDRNRFLVIGDQIRLYQILYNLLNNAIRFTDQGEVKLKVVKLSLTADMVTLLFEVRDTGVGIDARTIQQIYEPYYRQKMLDYNNFGIGLGTFIIRKLLLEHHSVLQCDSVVGKGTVFSFELTYPIDLQDNDLVQNQIIQAESQFKKLKVLVVEDNEMNVALITRILASWEIRFDISNDGYDATVKAQENHYDLIIMDLNMPVMDGFEASGIIKKLDPNTKIVILSATLQADIKSQFDASDVDGFLSKPFVKEDLRNLIYQKCIRA